MFVDLSFEYDCCHEEYIGKTVLGISANGLWTAYHTDKGKEYLKKFDVDPGELHKRIKIPFDKASDIYKETPLDISKSYGGFYWKNIEHTEHVGT